MPDDTLSPDKSRTRGNSDALVQEYERVQEAIAAEQRSRPEEEVHVNLGHPPCSDVEDQAVRQFKPYNLKGSVVCAVIAGVCGWVALSESLDALWVRLNVWGSTDVTHLITATIICGALAFLLGFPFPSRQRQRRTSSSD